MKITQLDGFAGVIVAWFVYTSALILIIPELYILVQNPVLAFSVIILIYGGIAMGYYVCKLHTSIKNVRGAKK